MLSCVTRNLSQRAFISQLPSSSSCLLLPLPPHPPTVPSDVHLAHTTPGSSAGHCSGSSLSRYPSRAAPAIPDSIPGLLFHTHIHTPFHLVAWDLVKPRKGPTISWLPYARCGLPPPPEVGPSSSPHRDLGTPTFPDDSEGAEALQSG